MNKLIFLLFVLTGTALGQVGRFDGNVPSSGTPNGPATIAVCQPGGSGGPPCSPLAVVYSDQSGQTQQANPFSADINGHYTFFAPSGSYVVQSYGNGYSTALTTVTVGPNGNTPTTSGANIWPAPQTFGKGVSVGLSIPLPTGLAPGTIVVATNGASGTDCTVGGGASHVFCEFNGSAWQAFGGSGSGITGASNAFALVGNGATTGTSYTSTQSPRIYAFLVPGTGGGTDLCSKWNAALLLLPASGGTVDLSVGFADPQFCLMNPYNAVANTLESYSQLGFYRLFQSVPIFTNQFRHVIQGMGTGSGSTRNGTILIACNATGPATCAASGNPTFPNASDVLTFARQHGPFAAGSYSALIHGGGAGVTGGSSAFGEQIRDITFDLNGVSNAFAYYTTEEQELSILDGINIFNTGANSAGVFYDATEVDGTGTHGPGPHGPQIRRFHIVNPASSTNTYAIVSEGARIQVGVSGLTCTTQPKAYASVSAGAVTITQTYYGSGCTGTPACTVTSGDVPTVGATCSATLNSPGAGQVTIARTAAGSGYSNGDTNAATIYIDNGTVAGSSTFGLTDAIWLDGQNDTHTNNIHCEWSTNCVQWGNGTGFMQGGAIDNLDGVNSPGGTTAEVDIANGGDGGVIVKAVDGTLTNLITDEMTNAVSGIQDGSHFVSWTKSTLTKALELYSPFGVQAPSGVFVPEVTFANLPACSSGLAGLERSISDSNTVVFNATAAGSGTNHVAVRCNGTNWVVF